MSVLSSVSLNTTLNPMEHSSNSISINQQQKNYLLSIAQWAKVLACVAYTFLATYFLLSVFILNFALKGKNTVQNMVSGLGINHIGMGSMLASLLLAIICVIPIYQLGQFSSLTKKALQNNKEEQLTQAFSKLKNVFQFWGILSVLIAVYYGAMLIKVVFIVGIMAGFSFLK